MSQTQYSCPCLIMGNDIGIKIAFSSNTQSTFSAWKLGNEWYRIRKLKILSLAAFDEKDLHLEIVCLILSERIFIFTDLMISMSVALCIRRSHCVSCGGWRDTHTSGHWTRVSWRPRTSLLYWPPITPLSTCCHGLFCLRNSYHSG